MTTYKAIEFVVIECANCGVPFCTSAKFDREKRRSHDSFYCPNGHSQYYHGESDLERAKARAANLERQLISERDRHQGTKRRLSAAKGQLTKTKNRIKNGVCPCCNRFFANLHRHMENQHPEYSGAENE